MWHSIAASLLSVLIGAHLVLRLRRSHAARAREVAGFFARCGGILDHDRIESLAAVGYPRLCGRFGELPAQVQPVVDTLAVRRLPVLWLLVTLQGALPVKAKLDLMMRPAGPTTFSNFDLLPVTLDRPVGFPDQAVLRTDDVRQVLSPEVLRPHMDMFADPCAKELLISPNGVRIVWMLAEGDRVRYGLLRQADFHGIDLDPDLLRMLLGKLMAVRQSVLDGRRAAA
jgi:hypothetical protein